VALRNEGKQTELRSRSGFIKGAKLFTYRDISSDGIKTSLEGSTSYDKDGWKFYLVGRTADDTDIEVTLTEKAVKNILEDIKKHKTIV
jgi:hypothetical protein